MIKGVISDMDGVILDSEKLYVRFWCEAAQSLGYPMQPQHALGIRSLGRPFAIKKLCGWFGEDFDYDAVRNRRIELMDAHVTQYGIEAKEGARETLCAIKNAGLPIALATATPVERAEKYLDAVGLLGFFDKIVSARMVKNGKPAPDIYLFAAKQLRLAPGDCLALEDSQNGIRSAAAAGCRAVLVPDLDNPEKELDGLLYSVAGKLTDVIDLIDKENR